MSKTYKNGCNPLLHKELLPAMGSPHVREECPHHRQTPTKSKHFLENEGFPDKNDA
jgi:hypothetical protein